MKSSSSSLIYSHHHQPPRSVGVYIITVMLMVAILVVSFYEPRWIHTGEFIERQKALVDSKKSFEDVLDLRERITESSQRGKKSKSLQTISVETEYLLSDSVKYIICKPLKERIKAIQNPSLVNPIDPLDIKNMDKDLIVYNFGENSPTFAYSLVLNKFNTIPDHCLIVSNQYKPQIGLLTEEEFALWIWLAVKIKGIGVFNSNKIAGASQRHKHLQIIPQDSISKFVDNSAQSNIPLNEFILPKIRNGLVKLLSVDSDVERLDEYVNQIDQFPFIHSYIALDSTSLNGLDSIQQATKFGTVLQRAYRYLLKKIQVDENVLRDCGEMQKSFSYRVYSRCDEKGAYNIVLTPNYILLVPRSKLEFHDSINGLGFLGIFLSTSPESLNDLRKIGPLQALAYVSKVKSTQIS